MIRSMSLANIIVEMFGDDVIVRIESDRGGIYYFEFDPETLYWYRMENFTLFYGLVNEDCYD